MTPPCVWISGRKTLSRVTRTSRMHYTIIRPKYSCFYICERNEKLGHSGMKQVMPRQAGYYAEKTDAPPGKGSCLFDAGLKAPFIEKPMNGYCRERSELCEHLSSANNVRALDEGTA